MPSAEYTDVSVAYESAKVQIGKIADGNNWTTEQRAKAISDADKAYEEFSGALDVASAMFSKSFSFTSSLWTLSADTQIELAKGFWSKLYQYAKDGWASFPNGSKAIAWLASASGTASVVTEANKESAPVTQVTNATVQTATDLRKAGEKAGEIASNPAVWYGLGAAAILGAIVYVRGIFR